MKSTIIAIIACAGAGFAQVPATAENTVADLQKEIARVFAEPNACRSLGAANGKLQFIEYWAEGWFFDVSAFHGLHVEVAPTTPIQGKIEVIDNDAYFAWTLEWNGDASKYKAGWEAAWADWNCYASASGRQGCVQHIDAMKQAIQRIGAARAPELNTAAELAVQGHALACADILLDCARLLIGNPAIKQCVKA